MTEPAHFSFDCHSNRFNRSKFNQSNWTFQLLLKPGRSTASAKQHPNFFFCFFFNDNKCDPSKLNRFNQVQFIKIILWSFICFRFGFLELFAINDVLCISSSSNKDMLRQQKEYIGCNIGCNIRCNNRFHSEYLRFICFGCRCVLFVAVFLFLSFSASLSLWLWLWLWLSLSLFRRRSISLVVSISSFEKNHVSLIKTGTFSPVLIWLSFSNEFNTS